MKPESVNPKLRAAIKLRWLVDAITENWQKMRDVSQEMQNALEEAISYMNAYGTEEAQQKYNHDIMQSNQDVATIRKLLSEASDALNSEDSSDFKVSWDKFQKSFTVVEKEFSSFSEIPKSSFTDGNHEGWKSIWKVMQSNLFAVKGLSEAAHLRAQMIEAFSKEELDDLTMTIARHIPKNFTLVEANQYEKDYLKAMEMIKL